MYPTSSLLFIAYLYLFVIPFIFALSPGTQVSLNSAFCEDGREAYTESNRIDHDQLSIILDILGTPSIDDFYAITSQRSREYIRALPFRKKKNFQTLFPNASPLVSFKFLVVRPCYVAVIGYSGAFVRLIVLFLFFCSMLPRENGH